MLKIVITDCGSAILDRFSFDINPLINKILQYIPKSDLMGLGYIYITALPKSRELHSRETWGIYNKKNNNCPAYIEIYIENFFGRIKNTEAFAKMLDLHSINIAETLFHEVGHHLEQTRSHGIKKNNIEGFAKKYAEKLLNKYMVSNVTSINKCADALISELQEKGVSDEVIQEMKNSLEQWFGVALVRTAKTSKSDMDDSI